MTTAIPASTENPENRPERSSSDAAIFSSMLTNLDNIVEQGLERHLGLVDALRPEFRASITISVSFGYLSRACAARVWRTFPLTLCPRPRAPRRISRPSHGLWREHSAQSNWCRLGAVQACPVNERWPGVSHTELPATGRHSHRSRTLLPAFSGTMAAEPPFRRDSVPVDLRRPAAAGAFRTSRLIFEVNGLPSIELKYRYPGAEDDRELMRKLQAQEQACLNAADMVITPSAVTRQYLISTRRVSPGKVKVIANGVDGEMFRPREPDASRVLRLLYFGTLSAWQGVDLGIRALAQVRYHVPAEFTIIGAGSDRSGMRSRHWLAGLASAMLSMCCRRCRKPS